MFIKTHLHWRFEHMDVKKDKDTIAHKHEFSYVGSMSVYLHNPGLG